MNNKLVGFAVVLGLVAVLIAGVSLLRPAEVVYQPVGASSGPEHTQTEYFYNGLSVGGGGVLGKLYATTLTWDSGGIALNSQATSTFTLSKNGVSNILPAVGDMCMVANQSASSSRGESYDFKITAANAITASGTLTYRNYESLVDYGSATLELACFTQ